MKRISDEFTFDVPDSRNELSAVRITNSATCLQNLLVERLIPQKEKTAEVMEVNKKLRKETANLHDRLEQVPFNWMLPRDIARFAL